MEIKNLFKFDFLEPHLGHLYTGTLADANFRWNRLKNGRDPYATGAAVESDDLFVVGTDEHGAKVKCAFFHDLIFNFRFNVLPNVPKRRQLSIVIFIVSDSGNCFLNLTSITLTLSAPVKLSTRKLL